MSKWLIRNPKIDSRPYVLKVEGVKEEEEREKELPQPSSPPSQHSSVQEEGVVDLKTAFEDAKRTAEDIVRKAEEEANRVKKEGYERGYEEGFRIGYENGYRKGEEEGEKKLEELRRRMMLFIERLELYKAELASEIEEKILKIALDVARKIVKDEIRQRPELVLLSVKEAVLRSLGPSSIKILVNAEDLERVEGFKEEIKRISDEIEEIEIVPDSRVEPGGCIVETPMGRVDARIEAQFERIKETLGGSLGD